jgi:CSLREA domain-containing protein
MVGRIRTGWRGTVTLMATVALGLTLAQAARAANTFTVTTGTDSSDGSCTHTLCSLRDAVEAADTAGGASTINLPRGEYRLTIPPSCSSSVGCDANDPDHGDLDIDNDASVTIKGAGATQTIINPNQVDRAFAVQKGASLSISGTMLENGAGSKYSTDAQTVALAGGGAVYSDGALTLTDDMLTANGGSNNAPWGGAVFVDEDATRLQVTGSTFLDNDNLPDAGGGAISINNVKTSATAPLSVSDSSFFDNGNTFFSDGGAIELNAGRLTVSSSTFIGNQAAGGGAISEGFDTNRGSPPTLALIVRNSTLSQDDSQYGGGLAIDFGTVSITGSTISSNAVDFLGANGGGGIFLNGASSLSLTNSTISGNQAPVGGGIDLQSTAQGMLLNDTIAANTTSTNQGGGIQGVSDLAAGSTIENTLIAQNGGGNCDSGLTAAEDHGHNLDSDGTCFGTSHGTGDLVNKNPLLMALANNGGPTETMALRVGSPAIDAGSAKADCPAADQRGDPRPDDGEARCDIGAYEFQDPVLLVRFAGKGHGSVTGSGIACSKTCSKSYNPNTHVTLTAKAAAGSKFAGWSGACTGTGACHVTMAASRRVTASFRVT